ncbi:MurT ligase domain-containing protein [Amnibacterium endophyticum]|uniref:MurT ligase domain-containing protein n=1 Tax=Amnibacterium endophyticum TaxID=2109337 RepID=A0ABW4LIU1_9MICO
MSLRFLPAVALGRAVRVAARLRKAGGGSAVPGLVVNRVAPGFLGATLSSFPEGLVVVTGSAGKSTTTKMLVAVLEAHGKRVFTNPSTANISQGLTSALLERASLTGRIDADLAVLEMDEGHGAALSDRFRSRLVLVTNVVTDQIDRFHDSEKVLAMVGRIAATATGTVVLNGDDGLLARLTPTAPVRRFGVTAEVLDAAPRGLGYAETAAERSDGVLVEAVRGREADVRIDGAATTVALPAKGVHYAVDAAGALAAAQALLGDAFRRDVAQGALAAMPPVFGRGEVVTVRGKRVEFVLVQNPASFQLNVDELDEGLEQVLVAMGSDVRDPSYFWPADASRIGRAIVVSGSKADEIALQLIYQGVQVVRIEPDLGAALDHFLALPDPARGMKTIVFTADSMRRTRSHLGLAR